MVVILGTLVPLLLLFWLYFVPKPSAPPEWSLSLAPINAGLNALSAIFLSLGYWAIRRGRISLHIKWMASALGSSSLFLITYLLYHHFHGDSSFKGQGVVRPIYFFILVSHIFLSAINFPMILLTVYHALSQQRDLHKKWARRTLPIWLYVSVTGVMIYGFLKLYA